MHARRPRRAQRRNAPKVRLLALGRTPQLTLRVPEHLNEVIAHTDILLLELGPIYRQLTQLTDKKSRIVNGTSKLAPHYYAGALSGSPLLVRRLVVLIVVVLVLPEWGVRAIAKQASLLLAIQ